MKRESSLSRGMNKKKPHIKARERIWSEHDWGGERRESLQSPVLLGPR